VEVIFYLCTLIIVYTYAVYPLLIFCLAGCRPKINSIALTKKIPEVTVVIAVHNGEEYIKDKIESIYSQSYPKDKLKIVFISDGSDDSTVSLIKQYPEIRLLENNTRKGKAFALNKAVSAVDTQYIIFTDIRQRLSSNAISLLIQQLNNDSVGAVSGELVLGGADGNASKQIGLYWRYEKFIRKSESRYKSVPGVTGALYAIKKKDYRDLESDTILDDFEVPMNIMRQGKRIIFESNAIAYDRVSNNMAVEKQRKIRTLAGNYQSFIRNLWLFSPYKNPIFWQFISHKVLRLIVPYCLILLFFIPLLVENDFIQTLFFIQCIVYFLALFGPKLNLPGVLGSIVNFLNVFLQMQLFVVIALMVFMSGKLNVKWKQVH
jgi:poly-beta-1,6-N-acetyl-D-glucosamine synthase